LNYTRGSRQRSDRYPDRRSLLKPAIT